MIMILSLFGCGKTDQTAQKESAQKEPAAETKQAATVEEKKEEPVKLKAYVTYTDAMWTKAFANITENVKQEYPNIDVEVEGFEGSDANAYNTKLRTYISAGTPPDVFFCHGGSFAAPLLKGNSALPMEKYLDDMKYWDNTILSQNKPLVDGHVYGVSLNTVFYEVMIANTALFKKYNVTLPKTYSEFAEAVKVFKANNIIPVSVAAKDGWPADMFVEGLAYSLDPECTLKVVRGEKKFSDNDAFRQAAIKTKELMDLGAFAKDVSLTDYTKALEIFKAGKAAMWSSGSWAFIDANQALGEENVALLYFPAIDDKPENYGLNAAGGVKPAAGMFVSSLTKYPAEAVKVAVNISMNANKYLYSQGDVATIYLAEKLGWKTDVPAASQVVQLMKDAAKFTKYGLILQDALPDAASSKAVMDSSAFFFTGQLSVDDYLKSMDKGLPAK